MSEEFSYDVQRNPPAPVIPLRVGQPGGEPGVSVMALMDTGADSTVIPEELARRLQLPIAGRVRVRGVGGVSHIVPVHSLAVELAGFRDIIRVIALGAETLVGRDLLNRWVATLRGPQRVLQIDVSGAAG